MNLKEKQSTHVECSLPQLSTARGQAGNSRNLDLISVDFFFFFFFSFYDKGIQTGELRIYERE